MKLRLETNLVLFSFSLFLLNSLWAYFLELTTLKYGRKLHLPKSKLKKKTFDLQMSLSLFSSFFLSFFSLFLCKVKMSVETEEYWISCLRISIQFPLILEQKKRSILSHFFFFFLVFDVKHGKTYLFQDMFTFFQYQKQECFFIKINIFPTNKYVPKKNSYLIIVWEKLHFWEEEGKLLCVGVMIDVQAKLEKSNPFFCLSW